MITKLSGTAWLTMKRGGTGLVPHKVTQSRPQHEVGIDLVTFQVKITIPAAVFAAIRVDLDVPESAIDVLQAKVESVDLDAGA